MPSSRWLLLLTLLFFLCCCEDRSLRQRAEQIREFSDREDRAYTSEALYHIKRKYWTIRDHAWLGKLPDGTIVRLESAHAVPAPLPSSAFYRGWHLQLTISSEDWRTYPEAPHKHPFVTVYAITRQSAASWEIRVSDGSVTFPLSREDIAHIEDDNQGRGNSN